jgi:hypothetical protein
MKNKFKFGGLLALLGVLGLASGTASATPIDYWFTNTGSIDVGTCTDASYCKTLTTQGDFKVGNEVLGTFQSTLTVLKFFDSDVAIRGAFPGRGVTEERLHFDSFDYAPRTS